MQRSLLTYVYNLRQWCRYRNIQILRVMTRIQWYLPPIAYEDKPLVTQSTSRQVCFLRDNPK